MFTLRNVLVFSLLLSLILWATLHASIGSPPPLPLVPTLPSPSIAPPYNATPSEGGFPQLPGVAPAPSPVVVAGNNSRMLTWKGWGTALAWWTAIVSQIDDARRQQVFDMLFSKETGLGLSIVRYLIPGGANFTNSPDLVYWSYRIPDGFLMNPAGPYNWSADAAQRAALFKAKSYGLDTIEAISFSPPWWMTVSGSVEGSWDGSPNITPENFGIFGDYLVTVIEHYQKEWGVTFDSLSALNEPLEKWWRLTKGTGQEGCGFNRTMMIPFFQMLREKLDARGLTNVGISGIDDWVKPSLYFLEHLSDADALQLPVMGRLQVHPYETPTHLNASYESDAVESMASLRAAADRFGLEIWQSEFGLILPDPHELLDFPASLLLARKICEHINILGVSAWSHWQAVIQCFGDCNDTATQQFGVIRIPQPYDVTQPLFISKQYYVTMQFSRWIRAGYTIQRLQGEPAKYMAMATDRPTRTLVVVALNEGVNATTYEVAKSRMRLVCSGSKDRRGVFVRTYRTSEFENHVDVGSGWENVCRQTFQIDVPPQSVVTVIVRQL